ncbi:hypothetical protein PUNSTDRAFT_25128, partial [Punctularia strigosozonata HHB-11173 SS5]|uniref:uncharacterized protein n=1 Tax=Punctularia strigosozonata (strain HHB-11173) TaxID=741275 RepID=UPI0004418382
AYERDDTFYFETITFLVEGCLFKVPREHFAKGSSVFEGMFALPVVGPSSIDGESDDRPLPLPGVSKHDFRQLLRVMFPRPSASGPPQLSCDEWVSVLKLSTMWQFAEIRARAVRELSAIAIDAVRKVVLAKKFSVDQWLLPALNEIARRAKPIDVEDIEKLGLEYALKLAEVRESF